MKCDLRFGLALCFAAAFGVQAAAGTIETATGAFEFDKPPEKVAVYDIAAIDTLHALGVTIAGVPNNLYLPPLREALSSVPTVGTLFEPDLEALNAAKPDLVIVGGRSSTQIDQVQRVAPAIDMTLWGDTLLDDARQRISDFGRLFGKEAEADDLLASYDGAIADARAAAAGKGDALIVMTNGPKISVYGADSRFGFLYGALDIAPVADSPDAGTHGDAVSFEFIAETDPDWLIVLDRADAIGSGEQGARATLDNELVRSTQAWQAGRVIYLPSAELYLAAGGAEATKRVFEVLQAGFSETE